MTTYKLALLLIFGVPAIVYSLKFTLLGAYRGLVLRNFPIGWNEGQPITGIAAVAIGIYSATLAIALVFAVGYLAVWMFG